MQCHDFLQIIKRPMKSCEAATYLRPAPLNKKYRAGVPPIRNRKLANCKGNFAPRPSPTHVTLSAFGAVEAEAAAPDDGDKPRQRRHPYGLHREAASDGLRGEALQPDIEWEKHEVRGGQHMKEGLRGAGEDVDGEKRPRGEFEEELEAEAGSAGLGGPKPGGADEITQEEIHRHRRGHREGEEDVGGRPLGEVQRSP